MKDWDERKRQVRAQNFRNAQRSTVAAPEDRVSTFRGHAHAEAFCLMRYACVGSFVDQPLSNSNRRAAPCGHQEIFWNSRDGVTPFAMGCPSCGGDLQHVDWRNDVYAPTHKPHQGQGVWQDGTPDEAEAIIRFCLKGTKYASDEKHAAMLIETVRNPKPPSEGGSCEFHKGWPSLVRWNILKLPNPQ